MSEVKASSPEPRSVEDREGAQAQEAVRLASPAEYSLPRAVRDFECEKRSITHRLTEVRHQMEELRVEEQRLLEEYHRVSEAQNTAKFAKLELELTRTTAVNRVLKEMAQSRK